MTELKDDDGKWKDLSELVLDALCLIKSGSC